MLDSFLSTVKKYHMLTYGDRVITGLSGGADSVLLLTLLVEIREKYGLSITAAHINHGIRGVEADGDEAFSREYCARLGVRFIAFHEDAVKEARLSGSSLEEAGRDIRYRRFEEAMRSGGANKIAVAHNRNDSAETTLMNIGRGTGLAGLCGIPPTRGAIIRPLIETGRDEIETYLSERHIPYRTDSTNQSGDYTRNRVRNALIPEIESVLGVNLGEKLGALSRLCARDEDCLEKAARDAYAAVLVSGEQGAVRLSVPGLRNYHPAIGSRVIRLALSQWGLKDVSARHARAAEELLFSVRSGKQICLPGGLLIQKVYNELRFSSERPDAPPAFRYDLTPETPLYVPELARHFLLSENKAPLDAGAVCTKAFAYDILANVEACRDTTRTTSHDCVSAVNDNVARYKIGDIQIRSRRPGDRIRIRHIGAVKLKEYFINHKIPGPMRDGIGLAARGGDVLWILDEKNICNEAYEASGREPRIIYIHMWE